jgi:transcriptional regulator with XRE-family HTH domain
MKINENIKKFRTFKGLTMEELGEKINVSKQTIQRYETGAITNIPYDKIEQMAEIFGITPGRLMGWEPVEKYTKTDDFHRIIAYYCKLTDTEKDSALDYLKFLADKQQKDE